VAWALLDQGVVSAGSFTVQIVLARQLPAAEYGTSALVFAGLGAMQLCNAALVIHPMSVRVPAAAEEARVPLLGGSLILLMGLTVPLAVVLAVSLRAFGRLDLVLPVLVFFVAWQLQEGLRRGLLSSMRHAAAVVGDATTYIGQGLLVLGLAGMLSLPTAFYAMAGSASLGAILHARRLRLAWPGGGAMRAITADYWAIGGGAALGNGVLATARIIALPWILGGFWGPAAAAGLQAANNIVNLTNPIIFGLFNLIPQAASGALAQGTAEAWRIVRFYSLVVSLPILLYSILVLAAPERLLLLFYGAGSDYLDLVLPLRLLILVTLIGFLVDSVIAFLHGIATVHRAVAINLAGTAATFLLAAPLASCFGLIGGCYALLAANLLRLLLAYIALLRVSAITRLTFSSSKRRGPGSSPSSRQH
jgi:O-antigen/teichoic acid export membrane protein